MQGYVAHSLVEALELRAAHPEAAPVAGGTDLMVELNFGRSEPPSLLDLSRVPELDRIERRDGHVFVGACVTFARIADELSELDALAEAARSVGSAQIRNRATIGGNLATASPAGDCLPVAAAWDGRVALSSSRGTRFVRWDDFLVGPKQTSLGEDELITGIELRAPKGPGVFAKTGPRSAVVIATAGVCVQLDDEHRTVRVALGSVGPTVLRATDAEAFGATIVPWNAPEASIDAEELVEFGLLAAAAARPIDDLRASAAYRTHVVDRLSRRLLQRAVARRGTPVSPVPERGGPC